MLLEHAYSLVLRYIEAYERADIDAVVAMFSSSAWIEDSAGAPIHKGETDIAAFYRSNLVSETKIVLKGPLRLLHGAAFMMELEARSFVAGGLDVCSKVEIWRVDDAGLIVSRQAYWGPSDHYRVLPG